MTQDNSTFRGGQGTGTGSSSSDLTTQAKESAKQAASQAKEQVGNLAGQAKEQAATRVSGQKDKVAESLGGMAHMLRQTGDQMRDQDQMGLTGFVDQAASQVENLSSYLRDNDMGRLVDDVERFARREPAIFLGGAFLLGLLGARFLKSSRPRPNYGEGYYASGYDAQYRPYYSGYASGDDYSSGAGYTSGMGGTGYTGGAGSSGMGGTGYTGGTGTSGTGYTGGTGSTGMGGTGSTGTGSTGMGGTGTGSTGSGNAGSGQGTRRNAGIYDTTREDT